MKYVYGILISFVFSSGIFAQVTPYLQIQVYTTQLTGSCDLSTAVAGNDTVFIHSGLDWKVPEPQILDSIWESIVGVWGVDTSPGAMVHLGTPTSDTFSICMNVKYYYSTFAAPPGLNEGQNGVGPMNTDSTPWNIGMVFRIGTCPYVDAQGKPECPEYDEGKDETCSNIYVLGLPYPNADSSIDVYDSGLDAFTAVSVRYVQGCPGSPYAGPTGIPALPEDVSSFSVYPSPFTAEAHIAFNLLTPTKPKVQILNDLGQIIADLSSQVSTGKNSIVWNGKDISGAPAPAGMYLVQINTGDRIYSNQIIKQ